MSPPDEEDSLPRVEHWSAVRLPALDDLRARLPVVFPEGLDGRAWAVAERAAKSLCVFLYAFAVEEVTENRLRPAMVTTMSDAQAARTSVTERLRWWDAARRPRPPSQEVTGRWFWW